MPATPLHFLAIAPLHFRWPRAFDVTALFFSSILVDSELGYFLLTGQPTTHWLWHSFLFVLTVYPVVLSLVVYVMERWFERRIFKIYGFLRFFPEKVKYSFRTILLCTLIGGASHIFFDMWVHEVSSYIFFPLVMDNPFWIGEYSIIPAVFVSLLSLYTVFLWIRQMLRHRETQVARREKER